MGTRGTASGRVRLEANVDVRNTLDDEVIASATISFRSVLTLTDGGEANMIDRAWQLKNAQLSSGAQVTHDIYDFEGIDIGAGTGRDHVGQALTMDEIVAVIIKNENDIDEDGVLSIEPAPSQGWTAIGSHLEADGGGLLGQGMLMKAQPAEAGFDVADGSSHRIRLTAVGGDVTYTIVLLGRSDDDVSSSSSSSVSSSSSSTSPSSASSASSSVSSQSSSPSS